MECRDQTCSLSNRLTDGCSLVPVCFPVEVRNSVESSTNLPSHPSIMEIQGGGSGVGEEGHPSFPLRMERRVRESESEILGE